MAGLLQALQQAGQSVNGNSVGRAPGFAGVRNPSAATRDDNELNAQQVQHNHLAAGDPNNITNDAGDLVGYANPFDSIKKFIQQGNYGSGSLLGFIQALLGGRQGALASTKSGLAGGSPGENPTNPTPVAKQKVPALQPKYAVPNIVPHEAIPAMRNTILQGQGLAPDRYTPSPNEPVTPDDGVDPNSLKGRMLSPNSKVDMLQQRQEMEDISKQFGRKKTSGILRMQPGKQSDSGQFQVAGNYVGDIRGTQEQDWRGTWEKAVSKPADPSAYMKSQPEDQEGATFPGSDMLWIRQKQGPPSDKTPVSENGERNLA